MKRSSRRTGGSDGTFKQKFADMQAKIDKQGTDAAKSAKEAKEKHVL
jgi:hypothetical protein